MALLGLAFITGLTIDIFYDSVGIHAAALVFIAYVRPYWINVLTPQGGYDLGANPTLGQMGLFWFLSYAFPLIFVHHFAIFYIEGGFSQFFFTLVKVFSSTLFTLLVLVVVQLLERR